MDPGALFAMIFGSEKFEPLVGELQLGMYIYIYIYVLHICVFIYVFS
jgi:hypothetical protein